MQCLNLAFIQDGKKGDRRQCNTCRVDLPISQFKVGGWRDEASRICLLCEDASRFSELPLDEQQMLESAAEHFNSTPGSQQSDDFKRSLSECVESGIERDRIALFIRTKSSGFDRMCFPYSGDSDYRRIHALVRRATASTPLLRDVKPGSERTHPF
jgi:hypothetical protein